MRYNSIYILFFLLTVNCRTVRVQDIEYDCRLFEADFSALDYVKGSSIETPFIDFTQDASDGVFFINRFLGEGKFYMAVLLKKETDRIVLVDLLKKERQVQLINEEQKNVEEILDNIEKGSFRQVCLEGSSEGSISVLIVKVRGVTTLKYEASQHDYSYLNEEEKVKIRNALELIKLLVDTLDRHVPGF